MKKPVKKEAIAADCGKDLTSVEEATELVTEGLARTKAQIWGDEEFLKKVLQHCIDSPELVVRESKQVDEKEKQLSIRGRTKRVKFYIYLSPAELEQLEGLKRIRGDRSVSDLLQQYIVLGLASLRAL